MSGNTFGTVFRVTTYGESHGPALGAVIDGCPSGLPLSAADIQKELDRRRPGQSSVTTPRKESDTAVIESGVFEGRTTGAPIAVRIVNENQRPSDYGDTARLFRPGHADRTWFEKYGLRDYRGGGRSSGRETAARVAAGAVAKKLLGLYGIRICAWTESIGPIAAKNGAPENAESNAVRCRDAEAAAEMEAYIQAKAAEKESVGGVVACRADGLPVGWGEPVFDKLDAVLAHAVLSVGGVKGIEFGSGFAASLLCGSENNRPGHSGGVLGGISDGEPLFFRVAVKPTPSVFKTQIFRGEDGTETETALRGRHDPCLCPRIVPVIEAMTAVVLADFALLGRCSRTGKPALQTEEKTLK